MLNTAIGRYKYWSGEYYFLKILYQEEFKDFCEELEYKKNIYGEYSQRGVYFQFSDMDYFSFVAEKCDEAEKLLRRLLK